MPRRMLLARSGEAFEELVGNALVQHQPAAGDAGLALVVEDRPRAAIDRCGEVGIVEDDVGSPCRRVQLDLLQVAGARLHDAAPGRGAAGEGDLGDLRVFGQVLAATLPRPGTMLTTPSGMPASLISSAIFSEQGVISAGFITTTQLPAASAGAIFHAVNISGKFHGTTCATTPTGSRSR